MEISEYHLRQLLRQLNRPRGSKAYRLRRGKLVEIPPEWQGKTIYKQTRNKRQPVSRRTRKNK